MYAIKWRDLGLNILNAFGTKKTQLATIGTFIMSARVSFARKINCWTKEKTYTRMDQKHHFLNITAINGLKNRKVKKKNTQKKTKKLLFFPIIYLKSGGNLDVPFDDYDIKFLRELVNQAGKTFLCCKT